MKFYLFSAKKSLFLEKLQNALVEYKKIFDERWQGEKYKWEAVKWFQDHWDINANDLCLLITAVIGCMVLSIWPFIVGMIWKSVPATVVTSLIAIVFRQVMISRDASGQDTFLQIRFVASETFVAVLFIFKKKVYELY